MCVFGLLHTGQSRLNIYLLWPLCAHTVIIIRYWTHMWYMHVGFMLGIQAYLNAALWVGYHPGFKFENEDGEEKCRAERPALRAKRDRSSTTTNTGSQPDVANSGSSGTWRRWLASRHILGILGSRARVSAFSGFFLMPSNGVRSELHLFRGLVQRGSITPDRRLD